MAALSFGLGGDRSIGSSVMLKSPIRKSGLGRCLVRLSRSTSAQKVGCSLGLLDAYMFIIEILSASDHFIFSIIARPCFRTWVLMLVGEIRALFIRNATPADARGFPGSLELAMSKFLPKHLFMSSNILPSR